MKQYVISEKELKKLVGRCQDVAVNSEWCNTIILVDDFLKSRKPVEMVAEGRSSDFWIKVFNDYNNDGSKFFKKVQGKSIKIFILECEK